MCVSKSSWFVLLICLSICWGVPTTESSAADPESLVVWELTDLQRPESAYYHAESGVIFLSQIVGDGAEKDGVGYISKVSLEGEMLDEQWVSGLNAPKGIRVHEGTLYVSDIDRIIAVDLETAEWRAIPVEGATFLNDVAAGPDGGVYVSDMRNSRIIALSPAGEVSVLAAGEEMESPNGLLVHDGKLVVGGWGNTPDTVGHLFTLDFDSLEKTLITPVPTGNLDGIEWDGKDGFVVTDWRAGKVLHIGAAGETRVLLELEPGTADHAFLPDRGWLILPRMLENKLTVYDISSLLE